MPYFLSHSSGSIPIEPSPSVDHRLAPAGGGEEVGEADALAAVVDLAVELEPVDAGGHRELELAGRADQLALGLDPPAGQDQVRVTCAIRLAGSSSVPGLEPRVLGLAEAQLEEHDVGRGLGRGVAADHQAELGRDRQRRGPAGRDHRAVVVELELGRAACRTPGPQFCRGVRRVRQGRGLALISSSRSDLDQLGRGDAGLGQDPAEHDVLLRLDEDDLLLVAEPDDPGHDARRRRTARRGRRPGSSRPGTSTSGSARSIRSARASPRRSEPRQAQRLPPSSERMSSANRQGWPSSQRIVGGSSSPSVRRSRSRPVRASRSTRAAWSLAEHEPARAHRSSVRRPAVEPRRRRATRPAVAAERRRPAPLPAGPGARGPRGRTCRAATPARATRA